MMNLSMVKIKAKHLMYDVFLYLEDEERFIFVSDIDSFEDGTIIVYFEKYIDDTGLVDEEFVFDAEDDVIIVNRYNITEEMIIEDVERNIKELSEIDD